jgi:hypothetical protein
MAEPLRSDRVKHLSNFSRTTPAFVNHREKLSCLKNIVQEMRPSSLRHPLRVGYDRGYRLSPPSPYHSPEASRPC